MFEGALEPPGPPVQHVSAKQRKLLSRFFTAAHHGKNDPSDELETF